jgi:hypothetical protein
LDRIKDVWEAVASEILRGKENRGKALGILGWPFNQFAPFQSDLIKIKKSIPSITHEEAKFDSLRPLLLDKKEMP